jgi:hypothetical protein
MERNGRILSSLPGALLGLMTWRAPYRVAHRRGGDPGGRTVLGPDEPAKREKKALPGPQDGRSPPLVAVRAIGDTPAMKSAILLAVIAGIAGAQSLGTPSNVLFPSNNDLAPTSQEIVIGADGTFVAVMGSLTTVADVLIVDVGKTGSPTVGTNVLFGGNNDVSSSNRSLVASRRGHFLCCYGSNGTVGDLVFMARNASGAWVVTNVLFPGGNDVPAVGTIPVISEDESFILCRGLSAIADLVIIPVNVAGGVWSPGTAFNETVPGGNTIPLSAVDPVIAPNALSFAVAGSNAAVGDLIMGTVGRPVSAANTTVGNVLLPGGNNLLSNLTPPVASPRSNYYAVHGQGAIGDLAVVAMNASGVPVAANNVLWPLSNNTGYASLPPPPPSVSGDGRLIAVNGTDSVNGDVVLVPIDANGVPHPAANVPFPQSNNVPNLQLPPIVSSDAAVVLQRGSAAIGDLVAIQVTFTSPTTIGGTVQNVLYPSSNNFPNVNAHIALAPDRSYAASLGTGTIGDLVITPIGPAGIAQTPINVLYPASNNVPNLGTTPRISREGLEVLTSGTGTIGDAVITGVEINYATGFVQPTFTTNVSYPASNDNSPTTREPVFAPTTQFVVSSGTTTIGDLVVLPLLDRFPRFLGRGDLGTTVTVRFLSPTDPGKTVLGAAAFGRRVGLPLPDLRIFPLDNDALLAFSIMPNVLFTSFAGTLDANGVYDGASIVLPPGTGFEGAWIYLAYAVIDPTAPLGVGPISKPSTFVIE